MLLELPSVQASSKTIRVTTRSVRAVATLGMDFGGPPRKPPEGGSYWFFDGISAEGDVVREVRMSLRRLWGNPRILRVTTNFAK